MGELQGARVAGLTASTPDPWDGYFVRDPDGSPTGTLQEGAAYDVLRTVASQPSVAQWKTYLLRAQQELHALGITGWQDAWVEPDLLRAYRELDDEGALTARVVAAMWWDRHGGIEQVDRLVEQREWATGGMLDADTVKIMLDGCPESCTGSMLEPYEGAFGERHDRGIQFVDAEMLREAVVALDARGFQVHQHALGDRAFRSALDAIEAARAANGWNDARHHIAHMQLPDPADLPRLRRLGVVANLQPYWAQPDPAIGEITAPRVGERASRLYPIGSIRASGAMMCIGSDWPVTTPNPWLELEVAVTRQPPGRDRRRAARRLAAHRPRDGDGGVRSRLGVREPRRRGGRARARHASRPRGARPRPVRPIARGDRRDQGRADDGLGPRRLRALLAPPDLRWNLCTRPGGSSDLVVGTQPLDAARS